MPTVTPPILEEFQLSDRREDACSPAVSHSRQSGVMGVEAWSKEIFEVSFGTTDTRTHTHWFYFPEKRLLSETVCSLSIFPCCASTVFTNRRRSGLWDCRCFNIPSCAG